MSVRKLTAPMLAVLGHRDPETRTELNRLRSTIYEWLRLVAQTVNLAIDALPITGEVTLAASPATTTSITDSRITATSRIVLTAKTANGAAAILGVYATAGAGSVTVNHTASALTDRTFHYAIFP